MSTFNRLLNSPAEHALSAIEDAARAKFKKANVTRAGDTITIETKMLWQTQTTTLTVTDNQVEATGNNADADSRAIKLLHEIDHLLDDQGWAESIEKLGTTTVKRQAIRDQVLAVLAPDERVAAATQGLELKKSCILVATQKRILLLEKDTLGFSSGSRTISLDKISAVSSDKKMLFGTIGITTSNEEIKVEKVPNDEVDAFITMVRHQMDNPAPRALELSAAAGGLDDLTKLADLHAAGVLTDEEFTAAKAKTLGI